jgi:LCP family protein required for cell wall assembly
MKARKTALILSLICVLASVLAACLNTTPTPTQVPGTSSPSASLTNTLTTTRTATRTLTSTATIDPLRPWGSFRAPAAALTPVTQIPPPVTALDRPQEVQALVLVGTDRNAPYVSRTDAIQLFIYHPRLSRASMISLPPDLMVYIPGYSMQRLQIAYAVGGWFGLADTIQYNFGIHPNHYVLVHLDEFVTFIDRNLKGLDINSLQAYPDPKYCGGIPAGTFHMNGSQVLCYIGFRVGTDEADRNRRQQEVFRLILLRVVQNGSLSKLADLYQAFRKTIETDLQLQDLIDAIPLVVKLGDARRINFYHLGPDELNLWKIPEDLSPSVFLPNRDAIRPIFQDALNFIQTPAPLSEVVSTYEAILTSAPSWTITFTPSITLTPSKTIPPTLTPTLTRTPSITPTPSRTPTLTPTGPTLTPTFTATGPTETPIP